MWICGEDDISRKNFGGKLLWKVTDSGPHSLDLSYSLTRNGGALGKTLNFSTSASRFMEHPPTGLLCRLGKHVSLARSLA